MQADSRRQPVSIAAQVLLDRLDDRVECPPVGPDVRGEDLSAADRLGIEQRAAMGS